MRTILNNMPPDKAIKELKIFSIFGVIAALSSLFVFGWLGIVGVAFSARAIVLSKHEGNNLRKVTKKYLFLAGIGFALSVLSLILYFL